MESEKHEKTAPEESGTRYASLDVSPGHAAMLAASAISEEVAAARGYRTVETKADLRRLGFADNQCRVPALLIPIRDAVGEIAAYQLRPDEPRINDRGKPVKYELPRGTRMVLDIPVAAHPHLREPAVPLVITEGAKKVDAALSVGMCCIGVLGVWNWRGRSENGGLAALGDWESIAFRSADGEGREVVLIFDSDVVEKASVARALNRRARRVAPSLTDILARVPEVIRMCETVCLSAHSPELTEGRRQALDEAAAYALLQSTQRLFQLRVRRATEVQGTPCVEALANV